jgi:hypothetical protein
MGGGLGEAGECRMTSQVLSPQFKVGAGAAVLRRDSDRINRIHRISAGAAAADAPLQSLDLGAWNGAQRLLRSGVPFRYIAAEMMARWNQVVLVLLALVAGRAGLQADMLQWDTARDRVAAEVETWTVPDVLQRVAASTGWQIFIDPEITNRIPAKFSSQQPGDALRRLLGEFNYALVPDAEGRSKLFVFRNSREQATRAIQPIEPTAKTKSSRIPNELVVTLKPGEKIEDVAKKLGAKIVGRSEGQNTYRLRFEDDRSADTARASLETDPAVESVDNNYVVNRPESVQALGTPGASLGLYPKLSPDGKYTVVGLIDSAVQPKQGGFEQFLLSASSGDESKAGTDPTHGTSMAETILRGLATLNEEKSTTVRIATANAFPNGTESTTTYDIALAIFKAAQDGAIIFNISAGTEGLSTYLKNTVADVTRQGGLVIAAAGNTPVTTATYPAAFPDVLAVTALDRSGKLAPYANRGDFVDVAAPGGSIISFNGQQYYVVGTSASTAYVSGMAAALAESKKISGNELRTAVLQMLAPKK